MKLLKLRWPALAILTLALGSTPLALHAQGTDTGTVTGKVTDPSGALIPDAVITLTDLATKNKLTTKTNKDGVYTLPGVPPATYTITATKTNFSTDEIPSQTVQVGTQTTANFALAVGAESTVIEVQAQNADLQTMNSTIGDTVSREDIANMPATQRDVSSFATLQPGVTPGGNVAGTTSDQAVFMVDGGNNSSDMDGGMQSYTGSFAGDPTGGKVGSGASGVMPTPQDSVEEFKVATAGQTADFNNSSGSQVQIVTRRGNNQFHASAYEYYLDTSFSGQPWQYSVTLAKKVITHYHRFGASAGGEIAPYFLGGKTYIFGNYEGFRYNAGSSYERTVPSAAFEAGNISFPASSVTVAGVTTIPTFTAAQITAADPRKLGLNSAVATYWKQYEPQQGTTYGGGYFDPGPTHCASVSNTGCDSYNTVGYISQISTPQTSNFYVFRLDHNFGSKEQFYTTYHVYRLNNLTSNQTDIGNYFGEGAVGKAVAIAPRPQIPWMYTAALTTNISPSFTSSLHYSYLRNFWSWGDLGTPPPPGGASAGLFGAAIEPGGESSSTSLSPLIEDAQNVRTRFWDGHDHFIGEDLTKLQGNHLIQFGGQYQHNFNYHQRTDNGSTTDYYQVYQLGETANGGSNITYSGFNAGGVPSGVGANARLLAMNTGIVTDNQIVYTRSGNNLALNPPLTPAFDQTTILFYNMYVSDTWHAKPSLTVNYGLGYAIEMPPSEKSGKIVTYVDATGAPVDASPYLQKKAQAAALGQSYNPELGFALIGNTANGGEKYPYAPFYKALSPRVSLAWNPKIENKFLKPIFGENATVLRGGYGRVYGRLNGVTLVLDTLLAPGLIQSVDCQNTLTTGACATASTDTNNYRVGPAGSGYDGSNLTPPAATANLPQPFYPGYNGGATNIPQALSPSLRPSSVDSFNVTVQRQINRKMLVEVGYIGRKISNEFEGLNLDSAPYMLSIGGQTFAKAYAALETTLGCATSIGLCLQQTAAAAKGNFPTFAPQPFFEAALAGTKYCNTALYSSCTAGVMSLEQANLATQKAWQVFSDLDAVGIVGAPRNMTQTPIPGQANGASGQIGGGAEEQGSYGYANYNALFTTFKLSSYHGLTMTGNFTYSKALGLNDSSQSSSGLIPADSFDLHKSYGVQSYNQKFIANIFGSYTTQWFKDSNGLLNRLAYGWNIAPVFTLGSGTPHACTDNSSTNEAFGGGSSQFASGDGEQCILTQAHIYSESTFRGVTGGTDPYGHSIGTSTLGSGSSAVNAFTNPVAVWNAARPPILGIDENDGGTGPLPTDRYWNLDLQVRKQVKAWERVNFEVSAISTNVLNHLVMGSYGLNLTNNSTWGVVTGQGNNPRTIQLGIRANY